MKKRGRPGGPREADPNTTAKSFIDQVARRTEGRPEPEKPKEKNPAAVALGRLGGSKGGKARAAKLSPEKRAEIAKKAVEKRWSSTD